MASPFTLQDPIFVTQCPGCAAVYALPAERMGPAGARIRCPRCERVYDLRRSRDPNETRQPPALARSSPDPKPEPAVAPGATAEGFDPLGVRSAEVVARIAIEEIGDQRAQAMVAADAEGALFARHGAILLNAFDRYRARAGAGAPAAIFLEALRDRLGIDLPSWEASE